MWNALHVVIVAAVLLLLVRSAAAAWQNRRIALAVWRRIRPRHVLGSLGLIIVVVGVAIMIATALPVTRFGLGSLVGVQGNAVFAPIEDVLLESPSPARGGTDWLDVALVTGFCLLLLALFPWLAYVEERTFRRGLEHASFGRQLSVALRFGLAHLVMLIPLAAALAIGVAGFAYGLAYRHAYRNAVAQPGPHRTQPPQAQAILASTIWHTTFNSLLVATLLLTVTPTL